jgi:hypothetical protein
MACLSGKKQRNLVLIAKRITTATGLLLVTLVVITVVLWVHFTGVRLICHSELTDKEAAQKVASSLVRREFGDNRATRFSEAFSENHGAPTLSKLIVSGVGEAGRLSRKANFKMALLRRP